MAEILEQLMSPRMLSSSTAAPDEPTLFPHPATPPSTCQSCFLSYVEREGICVNSASRGAGGGDQTPLGKAVTARPDPQNPPPRESPITLGITPRCSYGSQVRNGDENVLRMYRT